jgi:hypothetical protein
MLRLDLVRVFLGAHTLRFWGGMISYNNISPFNAYRKKEGWFTGYTHL